jgi:hypothetical protein
MRHVAAVFLILALVRVVMPVKQCGEDYFIVWPWQAWHYVEAHTEGGHWEAGREQTILGVRRPYVPGYWVEGTQTEGHWRNICEGGRPVAGMTGVQFFAFVVVAVICWRVGKSGPLVIIETPERGSRRRS